MASNKIQIKRSVANGVVTGLANGELAFTQASNTLWIGLPDGSGPAAIAGVRNPGTLTANQALVANSTGGIDKVITSNAVITTLWANGSGGSNGQVLVTNGTAVFWGTGTSGTNTQVQFNDSGVANGSAGFTFDKTSNTLAISNTINTVNINATSINATSVNGSQLTVGGWVVANDGGVYTTGGVNAAVISIGTDFYANSTQISFTGSNIDATSATLNINYANVGQDLTVNGNTTLNGNTVLGDASSDIINPIASFANNIMPSANVTYDIGSSTMRWNEIHASNVHSITGYFDGNVEIGGDLVVTGNVVTQNVHSVIVSDPLIFLAGNNTSSDLLDIGFAGQYYDGSYERWTGLFRDHADNGIYKLFTNSRQDLLSNNDVDPSYNGYQTATLQTYLLSGGLVSNSSNVQITANSTLGVSIVANTLSLTSALPGTSGGTGLNSYTQEDILVANATNGFRKLSLGTAGYVLQSNGSALVYDTLDGGTF
jgi:hypothetical protein